jgi:hypothetical protein
MESQLNAHPQYHRPLPMAKCAGQVRVDGQPPQKDCKLFVILHRRDHLDEAVRARGAGYQLYATCDADGNFMFRNGLEPGAYVVTFVELHPRVARSSRNANGGSRPGRNTANPRGLMRPDELKNLYNDPDKNIKEANFNLDLAYPGKEDYHFDLTVAGQEAIATPGSNAIAGVPAN